MKRHPGKNFNISSEDTFDDIWMQAGRFIPYPEVVTHALDSMATRQNWPTALREIALEITRKSRHLDTVTGLQELRSQEINSDLIQRYQKFQAENPDVLTGITPLRFWGDITNMGGLNKALTRTAEQKIDDHISVEGIKRGNRFVRLVAEIVRTRLSDAFGRNAVHLYREGGDEIGGYILVPENQDNRAIMDKTVEDINAEIRRVARQLNLHTIAHHKAPDDPLRTGCGYVCAWTQANFEAPETTQKNLEDLVEQRKQQSAQNIAVTQVSKGQLRLPDDEISLINARFSDILLERGLPPQQFDNIVLSFDDATRGEHVLPAKARKAYVRKLAAAYPDFKHLDVIESLLDKYNKNESTGVYKDQDLDSAMMSTSRQAGGYLLLAQQTNLRGLNQSFGHAVCDEVIEDIQSIVNATVQGLFPERYTGVFEAKINYMASRNTLAIVLPDATPDTVISVIQALDRNIQEYTRRHALDDVPHTGPKNIKGVKVVFGAQAIPKSIFHPGIAREITSRAKAEAEYNETNDIIFNPARFLKANQPSKNNHNRLSPAPKK